jgi:hypothetical protein
MNPNAIPGLAEAVAKEKFLRNASFLSCHEAILGVPVLPLTIRQLVALELIGSPFVCGGRPPNELDVAAFIWLCSPRYRAESKWRRWWFLRSIRKLDYLATVKAIVEHVNEAFSDMPGSSRVRHVTSYYSAVASLVDLLAAEYGWSEEKILALPLKRVFQYANAITRRRDPQAIMFNPSDRIKGDWLNSRVKAN